MKEKGDAANVRHLIKTRQISTHVAREQSAYFISGSLLLHRLHLSVIPVVFPVWILILPCIVLRPLYEVNTSHGNYSKQPEHLQLICLTSWDGKQHGSLSSSHTTNNTFQCRRHWNNRHDETRLLLTSQPHLLVHWLLFVSDQNKEHVTHSGSVWSVWPHSTVADMSFNPWKKSPVHLTAFCFCFTTLQISRFILIYV